MRPHFRMSAVNALLLVTLLVLPTARAAPLNNVILERMGEIMDALYRLDHDRAESLSRKVMADYPDHPAGDLFLARTYWALELNRKHALSMDRFAAPDFFDQDAKHYRYRIQVDPDLEARFEQASRKAIEKAKILLDTDPDMGNFLLGLAYQNLTTFDASLKGGWWSAFRSGRRTVEYHQKLLASNPGLADPLLAIGVYDYVAASVPWQIRWLTILLGMSSGDKEKGKQNLEKAAREAILVADDAKTVLALIYTREKQYRKAFDLLTGLSTEYPENYLLQLDRASLARRMDEPALALAILGKVLDHIQSREPGYQNLELAMIYNQLGISQRQTGNLRAAENWFRISLEQGRPSSRSATIAHLELGKTLDLAGRRTDALAHYEKVRRADDVAGSQEEAAGLLRKPYRQ